MSYRKQDLILIGGIFLTVSTLALLFTGGGNNDPSDPDITTFQGTWALDDDIMGHVGAGPRFAMVNISLKHMEYSQGSGTIKKEGDWHDGGFWCAKADGTGEIEVAHLVDPETLELHLSFFYPGNSLVLTLYKRRGSAEEARAEMAKYPPPYTYPPPAGVIVPWMTEYQLNSLPWKSDGNIRTNILDDNLEETIFTYRSDVPDRDPLEVTVKDHRVIRVSGGNS